MKKRHDVLVSEQLARVQDGTVPTLDGRDSKDAVTCAQIGHQMGTAHWRSPNQNDKQYSSAGSND